MSKKVVMVYDYVPGKIVKSETHFLKYIDKEGRVYKAPVPPRVIERGTVSKRLVAQLHIDKFVYHMPYYLHIQKRNNSTCRFLGMWSEPSFAGI